MDEDTTTMPQADEPTVMPSPDMPEEPVTETPAPEAQDESMPEQPETPEAPAL